MRFLWFRKVFTKTLGLKLSLISLCEVVSYKIIIKTVHKSIINSELYFWIHLNLLADILRTYRISTFNTDITVLTAFLYETFLYSQIILIYFTVFLHSRQNFILVSQHQFEVIFKLLINFSLKFWLFKFAKSIDLSIDLLVINWAIDEVDSQTGDSYLKLETNSLTAVLFFNVLIAISLVLSLESFFYNQLLYLYD
jgi:hypothetical protein